MEAFGNGASFKQLERRLVLGTIMQFREFFTELLKIKTCCKIWTSRKKTKQQKNPLNF
jgi:hypothetical protein